MMKETSSNRRLLSIELLTQLSRREVSKHEVISGAYFPKFGLNTGKYGPEVTPYLDTYHAV